jgi:cytochrome c oxidase cbb3-type subunit 3/ubiquinol-cytochrome c reductase cytochrome c subunit
MKALPLMASLMLCTLVVGATGCGRAPGKPGNGADVARPEEVLDFATLYSQNCGACHGEKGTNGAAISLANPVYLATAGGANIQRITAAGLNGTMMPGFAKSAGGMLSDKQIAAITQGMIDAWAKPAALAGQTPPAYAGSSSGDASQGQQTFQAFCARCHGADATGAQSANLRTGSLVDPSYLSLISDQGLRSFIIAGQPEQGMPDWRSHESANGGHALTDREITDIVAWIGTHRTATPGQVYRQNP